MDWQIRFLFVSSKFHSPCGVWNDSIHCLLQQYKAKPTIMALQVLKMVCYQVIHFLFQSDCNVFTLKMLGFFCVCVYRFLFKFT